jgi:hypothetical protein
MMLAQIAYSFFRIPFEPKLHTKLLQQNGMYAQYANCGCGARQMLARRQTYRRT